MAEPGPSTNDPLENAVESKSNAPAGGRSKDEVALELMKFIAVATGYGRASQSSTGFSAKPGTRTPEENAEALLELFQRCRKAVGQEN